MKKILLVEDEPAIREPFELVLNTLDAVVHAAANGNEAIELCKENSYDLILLDLIMPLCNGVEFLETYQKADYRNPKAKIVVLSNLTSGPEIDDALKLGVKDSVLKASLTPSTLLELVHSKIG